MVGKFKLKDRTKIAWDPDTNITWTGDKVIESKLTVFVAKCITKNVLIEVKGKEATEEKKEIKEEKIKRLEGVVVQKVEELEKADDKDFDKKKKELEQAEIDLKEAEAKK